MEAGKGKKKCLDKISKYGKLAKNGNSRPGGKRGCAQAGILTWGSSYTRDKGRTGGED